MQSVWWYCAGSDAAGGLRLAAPRRVPAQVERALRRAAALPGQPLRRARDTLLQQVYNRLCMSHFYPFRKQKQSIINLAYPSVHLCVYYSATNE